MKKRIYSFIATVLFSAAFAVTAFAATGKISFSDPTVQLGSDVNVTMKVASGDGTLSTADVTVSYDAKLLQFVSGTDADGGAGSVRIHGASNGAGTGTLEYNLKFKSLAAGTANVTITTQEVYDSDNQIVDIQHEGSSAVTIAAPASASSDAALASLTVSPGTLTPAFSADVTSYDVTVGTDVDVLAVNAAAADSGASVALSGNENLQMGENTVTVKVTAADGKSSSVYTLNVTKQEGGPSLSDAQTQTETVNQGVKLSAKEKTITIMNPGSDVTIPEGFAESSINIDGHEVRGWVWKADTNPQYCIVYGMNDAGDLNFYRYDLSEKTIQRYFQDPIEAEQTANAQKYPALVTEFDALAARYNTQFLISCVLGIVSLVLVIVIVLLLLRAKKERAARQYTGTVTVPQPKRPSKAAQQKDAAGQAPRSYGASDDTVVLERAARELPGLSSDDEDLGVTQVLRRPVPAGSAFGAAQQQTADGSAAPSDELVQENEPAEQDDAQQEDSGSSTGTDSGAQADAGYPDDSKAGAQAEYADAEQANEDSTAERAASQAGQAAGDNAPQAEYAAANDASALEGQTVRIDAKALKAAMDASADAQTVRIDEKELHAALRAREIKRKHAAFRPTADGGNAGTQQADSGLEIETLDLDDDAKQQTTPDNKKPAADDGLEIEEL